MVAGSSCRPSHRSPDERRGAAHFISSFFEDHRPALIKAKLKLSEHRRPKSLPTWTSLRKFAPSCPLLTHFGHAARIEGGYNEPARIGKL